MTKLSSPSARGRRSAPVPSGRSLRRFLRAAVLACVLPCTSIAHAQIVEITPFAGYRFGGDLYEAATATPVDRDGAPSAGVLVNVPMHSGLQFEGFFTRQSASLLVPTVPFGTSIQQRVIVEHFQAGGLQEFRAGKVRPFLTGTLGLSHYSSPGDDEIRVAFAMGGGVKLFPWKAVGIRLDTRVFSTFVDFDARATACGAGTCFVGVNASIAWQAEFVAGLVFRLR